MHNPADPRARGAGFSADALGLSDGAYTLLRDLIEERTGVFFDEGKRGLLSDKLSELVVAHGLTSFLDYYYLLRYDPGADSHWTRLLDRLAVPETYFWRQPEQLVALATHVAPRLLAARGAAPLRIWSAACCTGEEPLSIAIALAEHGLLERGDIRIVGSDASPAMVARARSGIFGERSFRALPLHLRDRYFRAEGGEWRIDPRLAARVEWTTANLVAPDDVRSLAAADVIFCRNVFIYFSDAAIQRVVDGFAERMPPDGWLFLGAAESLTRFSTAFVLRELGGAFAYTRSTAAGPLSAARDEPRLSMSESPAA